MSIFESAIERSDGKTLIVSNGSKWFGDAPDAIPELLKVLSQATLDPSFEQYHGYRPVPYLPEVRAGSKLHPWVEATSFFGNFQTVSHVFNIVTHDPEVIEKLDAAIQENMKTEAYQKAAYEKFADWFYAEVDGRLELICPALAAAIESNTVCPSRYRSRYEALKVARVLGPRFVGETPQPVPEGF